MKKLFNKKFFLAIGALAIVVIGIFVCASAFKPIPKPPVPDRKEWRGMDPDLMPYSHKTTWGSENGRKKAWARIRITDIAELETEYIAGTPRGGKICKFDVLDLIYGDEFKKEKKFYISLPSEDVQIGHEVIGLFEELEEDSDWFSAEYADYMLRSSLFFVDEYNKIQTAVYRQMLPLYEKYEGMDVNELVNDIKREMNEED